MLQSQHAMQESLQQLAYTMTLSPDAIVQNPQQVSLIQTLLQSMNQTTTSTTTNSSTGAYLSIMAQ